MGSNTLFLLPRTPGTNVVHIHTCKQNTHKIIKSKTKIKQTKIRAAEMPQQIKVLATKFDGLSLIPGIHMMGEESSDLHTYAMVPNPSPPPPHK